MRLHIKVTDTGEEHVFTEDEKEAEERFLGNCLATLEVSEKSEAGYVGPCVEIRWVP